jgi:hypothetical protein
MFGGQRVIWAASSLARVKCTSRYIGGFLGLAVERPTQPPDLTGFLKRTTTQDLKSRPGGRW